MAISHVLAAARLDVDSFAHYCLDSRVDARRRLSTAPRFRREASPPSASAAPVASLHGHLDSYELTTYRGRFLSEPVTAAQLQDTLAGHLGRVLNSRTSRLRIIEFIAVPLLALLLLAVCAVAIGPGDSGHFLVLPSRMALAVAVLVTLCRLGAVRRVPDWITGESDLVDQWVLSHTRSPRDPELARTLLGCYDTYLCHVDLTDQEKSFLYRSLLDMADDPHRAVEAQAVLDGMKHRIREVSHKRASHLLDDTGDTLPAAIRNAGHPIPAQPWPCAAAPTLTRPCGLPDSTRPGGVEA